MTLKSITYVSRTNIPNLSRETELETIISLARSRNAIFGVTGALISSAYTFAQRLEGPPTSIEKIMASIARDSRHRDVKIISEDSEKERQFPSWTMAFSGDANYIDRHVELLLEPSLYDADQLNVNQLKVLIEEFSKRMHR